MNPINRKGYVLCDITGTKKIPVQRMNESVLRCRFHRGKGGLRHDLAAKNSAVGLPLAWGSKNVLPGPGGAAGKGESLEHARHGILGDQGSVTWSVHRL